jgi:hypothetical protein
MAKPKKTNVLFQSSPESDLACGTRVRTAEEIDLRPTVKSTLPAGALGTVRAVQISTGLAWVRFDGLDSYYVPRNKLRRVYRE